MELGTKYTQCSRREKNQNFRDYKGISLLTIVYKILASAINNRLAQYAKDIGGEYQNGFRNN